MGFVDLADLRIKRGRPSCKLRFVLVAVITPSLVDRSCTGTGTVHHFNIQRIPGVP